MLTYPTLKMAPIQGLTGFGGGATGYLVSGASGFDWEGLSTGNTYQNGKVYKPDSSTFQIWHYPQSRKGSSTSYSMSDLTSSFQVRGQTNLIIYMVGGGGGGCGENGGAGSGGGGITVSSFTPTDGENFSFTVGKGGLGGVTGAGYGNWGPLLTNIGDQTNQSKPTAGNNTTLTGTGLSLSAGGGPKDDSTNSLSLTTAATNTTNLNSRGLSITLGSGGRGGGRSNMGEAGSNGNAGGGGANGYGNNTSDLRGGAGSGGFGGGGGAGTDYNQGSWSSTTRPGGSGSTYSFNGGYGGQANSPIQFGGDGVCPTDNTTDYPNFHAGGGRAYISSDNSSLGRGSSGGGGFPGGGGGSAIYQPYGVGSDGASGIVVFHWTI